MSVEVLENITLEEKIKKELFEHGIYPDLSGYGYILEAVKIIDGHRKQNRRYKLMYIYQLIAIKFDAINNSSVERAIRYIRDILIEKGHIESMTTGRFLARLQSDCLWIDNE